VFNNGNFRDPSNIKTYVIAVKVGSKTSLTQGVIKSYGTQVRPLTTSLGFPAQGSTFVMKNQIEIASVCGHNVFFQPGDSGSAVFTRNEHDGSLECIGMAIGVTSTLSAVVTPIRAILEALGPGITLTSFP